MIEKYGQDLTDLTDQLNQEQENRLEGFKSSQPGSIRPKGDPFTYNFDATSKTFTVATAPFSSADSVGKRIGPGQPGYDVLKGEATQMGLMKEEAAPDSSPAEMLSTELGFGGAIPDLKMVTDRKNMTRSNYENDLRVALSEFRKVSGHTVDITPIVERMMAPSIGVRSAIQILNNDIFPLLSGNPSSAKANNAFREAISSLKDWEKLVKLERLLGIQSAAEDGVVEASEKQEDSLKKIASLKDEYKKIFWTNPSNPFNRSNSKFNKR